MKRASEKVKANIILIISFMIFLFTYCFVMYTDMGSNKNVEINTNIEIKGGNDLVSQRLEEIIPYVTKTDALVKTAYQENLVNSDSIDNNVFLLKAYQNSEDKSLKAFNEVLVRLYSNNLFIVNNDFNVDGTINCSYDSQTLNYHCNEQTYDGIRYKVYREINKLNIQENNYYLDENVIFYSEEGSSNNITYKIYSDSTYQNEVETFMLNSNETIEDVLKSKSEKLQYRSKFMINKNNYRWLSTERIS